MIIANKRQISELIGKFLEITELLLLDEGADERIGIITFILQEASQLNTLTIKNFQSATQLKEIVGYLQPSLRNVMIIVDSSADCLKQVELLSKHLNKSCVLRIKPTLDFQLTPDYIKKLKALESKVPIAILDTYHRFDNESIQDYKEDKIYICSDLNQFQNGIIKTIQDDLKQRATQAKLSTAPTGTERSIARPHAGATISGDPSSSRDTAPVEVPQPHITFPQGAQSSGSARAIASQHTTTAQNTTVTMQHSGTAHPQLYTVAIPAPQGTISTYNPYVPPHYYPYPPTVPLFVHPAFMPTQTIPSCGLAAYSSPFAPVFTPVVYRPMAAAFTPPWATHVHATPQNAAASYTYLPEIEAEKVPHQPPVLTRKSRHTRNATPTSSVKSDSNSQISIQLNQAYEYPSNPSILIQLQGTDFLYNVSNINSLTKVISDAAIRPRVFGAEVKNAWRCQEHPGVTQNTMMLYKSSGNKYLIPYELFLDTIRTKVRPDDLPELKHILSKDSWSLINHEKREAPNSFVQRELDKDKRRKEGLEPGPGD